MNEKPEYSEDRLEHPGVKYEPKDIRFGCIFALLIAACCVAATHYFVVWKFFGWQKSVQEDIKKTPYRLAPTTTMQLPPEPRLEQLERMANEEKENFFKRELAQEKVLHSYGSTEEKGFVHIPVEEAIKAIAAELPVRKPPPEKSIKDNGLMDAGESNSGRMFRGDR